jgi:competence protein ComEC
VRLEVTATSTVVPGADFFAATITRTTIGRDPLEVSTPALVFATSTERFGIGATLAVEGTLRETAREDDVAFLVFGDNLTFERAPPLWLDWGNQLRSRFADAAGRLPGDGAALLPGLAIGDTTAVGDDLDAAMKASSLSHLTAVSGANCAVVVGLALLGGAALGVRRGVRIATAAVVLVGFVVLVTPEPSVLRAGVMALLVLTASLSGRPTRGIPLLATAVIALLVIDPWLSRNYGFVLSVLATGALLTLAGPLARVLGRWLPLSLSTVIAVPVAAQLACQPVLLMVNSSIPLYGVVANLLAEPAAPIATVLGLAACIALPMCEPLGVVIAWVAWVPAAWIAAVARFFTGLPGASVPWLAGIGGVVLLAVLTVAGVVAVLTSAKRVRVVAASVTVLLVVVMGSAVVGAKVTELLTRPSDWQIAACDIGQGDAVLVRDEGVVALVDTGPDPALLSACLDSLGIDHIDWLMLSHYDLDHVGGMDAVIGRVSKALVGPSDGADADRLVGRLRAGGAVITEANRGMTGALGRLAWSVLWPKSRLGPVQPGNDASVTIAFTPIGSCECLSSLFLGDLSGMAQSLVIAAGALPQVDVVKVAHHGSADQDPRTYQQVSAIVAVISVGIDNDYGHPTPELLGMLGVTQPLRTDTQGMVLLSGRDGGVSVWTER